MIPYVIVIGLLAGSVSVLVPSRHRRGVLVWAGIGVVLLWLALILPIARPDNVTLVETAFAAAGLAAANYVAGVAVPVGVGWLVRTVASKPPAATP